MRYVSLLLIVLFSCDNSSTKREYYESGKLKTEVEIKDDYYHGSYKMFFEDGSLKIEGNFYKHLKQGVWNYYSENNSLTESKEYIFVARESYLNQHFLFDKKGERLPFGNYFEILSPDTLKFEQQRIYIFLKHPFFSNKSNVKFILPKKPIELNEDFSNENKIEWDTIQSLALRFKNQNKYSDRNHDIIFDLDYQTFGEKRLRGILIEEIDYENSDSAAPSYHFHQGYFELNKTVLCDGLPTSQQTC